MGIDNYTAALKRANKAEAERDALRAEVAGSRDAVLVADARGVMIVSLSAEVARLSADNKQLRDSGRVTWTALQTTTAVTLVMGAEKVPLTAEQEQELGRWLLLRHPTTEVSDPADYLRAQLLDCEPCPGACGGDERCMWCDGDSEVKP